MPRLFIAVDLPAVQRAAVTDLRAPDLRGARWCPSEQYHATLRFIGATSDAACAEIAAALGAVRGTSFEVAVNGVGTFPASPNHARVLWAGLAPAAPLQALKKAIDGHLGPDREAADRGFHPHVTLARWKDRPGRDLRDYLARFAGFATAPFTVDAFHLFASQLGPEGATHELLRSYPLGAG